jgi:hypothetical protein
VTNNLRIGLALALVGDNVLGSTEDLESWVALNAILLAKVLLLCAVDLGELNVLLLQGGGSLLVLGGKCLAVATPRSKDYKCKCQLQLN